MEDRASFTDWKKRLRLIFGLVYIAILAIAAIYLLPEYWYLWLIMALVVLMRFISWASRKKKYRCTKCGTEFNQTKSRLALVPKAADLYGNEKVLKCPKCGSAMVKKIDSKN